MIQYEIRAAIPGHEYEFIIGTRAMPPEERRLADEEWRRGVLICQVGGTANSGEIIHKSPGMVVCTNPEHKHPVP